jgi:hypothetical protein
MFVNSNLSICSSKKVSSSLRHSDVFADLVMPQMMAPRAGWENLSENLEEGEFGSVDECRARCEGREECKQYSFGEEKGVCKTNVEPRLGRAGKGVVSGWIEERIRTFEQGMEPCPNGSWPF